ncbi:MAG: sulfurtransferase-like selenium metabolism protein YedF [Desulfobacteraceae bacterium]
MDRLDYTGLSCPQPVMETRKYLDEHPDAEAMCVVVDNKAASENVSRYLGSRGFQAEIRENGKNYQVTGSKTADDCACETFDPRTLERTTLVMITHNTMGTGSKELGAKLMVSFVKTLDEIKDSLWRLVFVNEGVKLTVEGSETYPLLADLEKQGVSILVCGTCLDFFGLVDKRKAGQTTNMLDIMTSLQVAAKVINM